MIKLRVVAAKADNPWLPEDVVSRPGIVACNLTTADPPPEIEPELAVQMGARAIITFLKREGLLDPGPGGSDPQSNRPAGPNDRLDRS